MNEAPMLATFIYTMAEKKQKRGPGRPTLENPKRHRLVAWVTEDDFNKIGMLQKQSGLCMSDFIREALLSVQMVVKPRLTPDELQTLKDLKREVSPIAHNLSEIAKYSKLDLFLKKRTELQNSIVALVDLVKVYENKLLKK